MRIERDDVVEQLIIAYTHTMDANNDNDEAMRMINAMADRIIKLLARSNGVKSITNTRVAIR